MNTKIEEFPVDKLWLLKCIYEELCECSEISLVTRSGLIDNVKEEKRKDIKRQKNLDVWLSNKRKIVKRHVVSNNKSTISDKFKNYKRIKSTETKLVFYRGFSLCRFSIEILKGIYTRFTIETHVSANSAYLFLSPPDLRHLMLKMNIYG